MDPEGIGGHRHRGLPLKFRTAAELAAAERYPSGRIKPDRSKWAEREQYPNPTPRGTPKTHPKTQPKTHPKTHPDPLAVTPTLFVYAKRNGTTIKLPVYSRVEAEAVAARLINHSWDAVIGGFEKDET